MHFNKAAFECLLKKCHNMMGGGGGSGHGEIGQISFAAASGKQPSVHLMAGRWGIFQCKENGPQLL